MAEQSSLAQSEAAKSWRSPTIDPSLGHQRVLIANEATVVFWAQHDVDLAVVTVEDRRLLQEGRQRQEHGRPARPEGALVGALGTSCRHQPMASVPWADS